MTKLTEARASRERDSYRIVRVNFRRATPGWWDEPIVVGFALGVSLLWLGVVVAFFTRHHLGG
jgi:hypothetical protein